MLERCFLYRASAKPKPGKCSSFCFGSCITENSTQHSLYTHYTVDSHASMHAYTIEIRCQTDVQFAIKFIKCRCYCVLARTNSNTKSHYIHSVPVRVSHILTFERERTNKTMELQQKLEWEVAGRKVMMIEVCNKWKSEWLNCHFFQFLLFF